MASFIITISKILVENFKVGTETLEAKVFLQEIFTGNKIIWDELDNIKNDDELNPMIIYQKTLVDGKSYMYFRRYKSKKNEAKVDEKNNGKDEKPTVFDILKIDKKHTRVVSERPSMAIAKKINGNWYIVSIGEFSKTIKNEYLDERFPIEVAFKACSYTSGEGTKNSYEPVEYPSLIQHDYINDFSSKNSSSREVVNIASIGLKDYTSIIVGGQIRVGNSTDKSDTFKESMKYKILQNRLNMTFGKQLKFSIKSGIDPLESIENALNDVNKIYNSKNNNLYVDYPFLKYYRPISSNTEKRNIWNKFVNDGKFHDAFFNLSPSEIEKIPGGEVEVKINFKGNAILKESISNILELSKLKKNIYTKIFEKFLSEGVDLLDVLDISNIIISVPDANFQTSYKFSHMLEINFQTKKDKENIMYYLIQGTWFEVNNDLTQKINEQFDSLVNSNRELITDSKFDLSKIQSATRGKTPFLHETLFNYLFAQENENRILVDALNLINASNELADIIEFDSEKLRLIHVKNGNRSTDIIYLFQQALFSLREFNGKREDTIKRLLNKFKSKWKNTKGSGGEIFSNIYYDNNIKDDKSKKVARIEELLINIKKIKIEVIVIVNNDNKDFPPMAKTAIVDVVNKIQQTFRGEGISFMFLKNKWEINENNNIKIEDITKKNVIDLGKLKK